MALSVVTLVALGGCQGGASSTPAGGESEAAGTSVRAPGEAGAKRSADTDFATLAGEDGEEAAEGDATMKPADLRADLSDLSRAGSGRRFNSAAGASGTKANGDLAREGAALFRGSAPANAADGGVESVNRYWTILITSFDAILEADQARQGLAKVQTVGRLPNAELQVRGKMLAIVVGRFNGSEDPKALAELKRVHELEVDGGRPFAGAVLMPPTAIGSTQGLGAYDLVNVRRAREDVNYTLQVGVYDWEPGATVDTMDRARRAAEEAVTTLRKDGWEAYFYHGPNASMVTVGLFDDEDISADDPFSESPELVRLRKQFPHNLMNGQGVRVRRPGQSAGNKNWSMVPSQVVHLPD